MKTKKIDFSKLIGHHYSIEDRMEILNWMLKTGKPYSERVGRWHVVGINQLLFDYGANNHDCVCALPKEYDQISLWFDAIFARAVYKYMPCKTIIEWRKNESICHGNYRMLKFNSEIPAGTWQKYNHITWLIKVIYDFDGQYLKKEFAHPDYDERTHPKIIGLKIYTTGNGWVVKYCFSFIEYNYEPGWEFSFQQNKNESIWTFFINVREQLSTHVLTESSSIHAL